MECGGDGLDFRPPRGLISVRRSASLLSLTSVLGYLSSIFEANQFVMFLVIMWTWNALLKLLVLHLLFTR